MKKLLIAIGILFIYSQAAFSQAALLVLLFGDKVASENFYFSLKAGANLSDISGTDEGKSRVGFNFGLVANIKLSDRWSLIPEFAPLSPKGNRDVPLKSTGNPSLDALLVNPDKSKREFNYIDIPVILRYKVSDRLFIGAGPQISLLTSAQAIYQSTPIEGNPLTYERDISSELNTIDYGLVFDLMYSVSNLLGGKGVDFHLRYALGLSDILKNNSGEAFTNSVFHITASFPFIEEQSE